MTFLVPSQSAFWNYPSCQPTLLELETIIPDIYIKVMWKSMRSVFICVTKKRSTKSDIVILYFYEITYLNATYCWSVNISWLAQIYCNYKYFKKLSNNFPTHPFLRRAPFFRPHYTKNNAYIDLEKSSPQ